MKKIYRAILIFVLLSPFLPAGPGNGADNPLFTVAERQWLKEHPVISVVVDVNPQAISIWADPARRLSHSRPPMQPGTGRLRPFPSRGTGSSPSGRSPGFPPNHPPAASNAPLKSVDPNEQRFFQGVAADYLQEVAKAAAISFSVESLTENNFGAVRQALTENTLDLTPSVMLGQPRSLSLHLSKPYIRLPVIVVMREDAGDLHDITQLKSLNVAGIPPVLPRLQGLGLTTDIRLVPPEAGLQGVSSGVFDAFVGDLSVISYVLRQNPIANIKVAGELPAPLEFCIAVSPRMQEFIPIFDKAVASIPRERKESIRQKWFGIAGAKTAATLLAEPKEMTEQAASLVLPDPTDSTESTTPSVPAEPVDATPSPTSQGSAPTPPAADSTASTAWFWLLFPALLLLTGGGFLLYSRGKRRSLRHDLTALEPHLLCVHIDRSLVITNVTEALCQATGYTENELLGRPLKILGAPAKNSGSKPRYLFNTVKRKGAWSGEAKLIKKDGSALWTDVFITPLRRKKETSGFTLIYQDASKRKHYENLAILDELTGLYNRRHFNATAPGLLNKAAREKKYFSLLLLDIDNFKKYNDNYGHPEGDKVLAAVGKCLKRTLQRRDDLVFRLGGEEFGILALLTAKNEVATIAEKILEGVRCLNIEHKYNPPGILTVSIGAHIFDARENLSIEDIYKLADKKLYLAKEQGKNRSIIAGENGTPGKNPV